MEQEIELKEYFRIIAKKWWIIISLMLIASIATGIYSFYFAQPQYAATAKVIVNKTSERQGEQYLDQSTISASIMLINTYKEIIKTPAIMDKVVERYPDLGLSSEQLISKVSVGSLQDSQVLTLAIVDGSHTRAVNIVNAVAEVFKDEIPSIMSVENVTILTKAKESEYAAPINRNPLVNIVISVMVSLLVSVGLIFLLEYLDDTVKTEMDIEKYLEVPTLITISKFKLKDFNAGSQGKMQRMVGGSGNVGVNS